MQPLIGLLSTFPRLVEIKTLRFRNLMQHEAGPKEEAQVRNVLVASSPSIFTINRYNPRFNVCSL